MKKFKGLLFLGAGLLVGVLFGAAVLWSVPPSNQPGRPPPPATGKAVPDFVLSGIDGKSVHLKDYQGKPVVINFWATWCPPCRAEMPLLSQTSAKLQDRVIFLAVDDDEDPAQVKNFVEQGRIIIPVLLDPGGKINALYYVESYPITLFLDSQGILRAQHIGQLDEQTLLRNLEAVGIKP